MFAQNLHFKLENKRNNKIKSLENQFSVLKLRKKKKKNHRISQFS